MPPVSPGAGFLPFAGNWDLKAEVPGSLAQPGPGVEPPLLQQVQVRRGRVCACVCGGRLNPLGGELWPCVSEPPVSRAEPVGGNLCQDWALDGICTLHVGAWPHCTLHVVQKAALCCRAGGPSSLRLHPACPLTGMSLDSERDSLC